MIGKAFKPSMGDAVGGWVRLRAAVLASMAALLLVGCGWKEERTLDFGSNSWTGYEPLYLARDLGYYDGQALRFIELTSATQVMDALRTGKLDAAALTLDEALVLAHEGVALSVIGVMDVSTGADAIVARPGIAKMADLQGRRVGVEQTAVGAYMLGAAFEQAGLGPDQISEITVVPLPMDEHVAAWSAHTVDALVTVEPLLQTLLQRGAQVIFDSRALEGEVVDVLVARKAALACCTKQLGQLLAGHRRALAYVDTHRDDALERMARRPGVAPAQVARALDGMLLPDSQTHRDLLTQPHALASTMAKLTQLMHQRQILVGEAAAQVQIDPRFVVSSHSQP